MLQRSVGLTKPKFYLLVVVAIGLLAVLTRLVRLSQPPELVFDEIYYVSFARDYLAGRDFFDSQPPVGTLLISAGIWLAGDNPIGWRVAPALAGVLSVGAIGYLGWLLFRSKNIAALAMFFMAIDGFMIVEARTAKLESFLVLFALGTLIAALKVAQTDEKWWLIGFGLAGGLLVGTKWLGAPVVVLGVVLYLLQKRPSLPQFLGSGAFFLGSFLVVSAIIFWLDTQLTGQPFSFEPIKMWHSQAWVYHTNLRAQHDYASAWWQWPFLIHPVLYYWKEAGPGLFRQITLVGNPVVWLVGLATTLYGLVRWIRRKKLDSLTLLAIGYSLTMIQFLPVKRILFSYHYALPLIFIILAAGWATGRLIQQKTTAWLGWAVAGATLVAFIVIYPINTAVAFSWRWY